MLDDGRKLLKISNKLSLDGNPVVNSAGEVVGLTMIGKENGDFAHCAVPSAQISAIPQKTAKKLSEVAAEYDLYLSKRSNTADDAIQYEKEPNDSEEEAYSIEKGIIYGSIDEEDFDVYRVQCNSSGYINVAIFSDSGNVHNLGLVTRNMAIDDDWHAGTKTAASDGTKTLFLRFRVEKPSAYYLAVFVPSDSTSPAFDYTIVYEFLPD